MRLKITNFQSVKKATHCSGFFTTLALYLNHQVNDIHFSEQALLLHLQD